MSWTLALILFSSFRIHATIFLPGSIYIHDVDLCQFRCRRVYVSEVRCVYNVNLNLTCFLHHSSGHMSESTGKHRRYVGIGYSVPAFITLLTLIAELALGRCAWGKPRFGEESCFFAGMYPLNNGRVEEISDHE